MTKAEQKIRFLVLQHRPLGFKFIRQKMIGPFIVDFYCSKLLLAIEIDGSSHDGREEYDSKRTYYLNKQGIDVMRYTNEQVLKKLDIVKHDILEQVISRGSILK